MDVPKPAPALYRLHVHTSCEDREATLQFCLAGGFLGVGWGAGADITEWSDYEQVAKDWYGRVDPSVRAVHDLPDGSLIWTRDIRGQYYLGQVNAPWVHIAGEHPDYFDIHNVRPAHIVACGVESVVPGKVANAFRPPRALQRIHDDAALRYSASLFAELAGQAAPWHAPLADVLTSCLTAQDLEDLVLMYMQRRMGYLAMPASRRADTPAYEYVLRHPDGHIAVVQVKTGWSSVPRDAGSLPVESADRVYVFSATSSYSGEPASNVITLDFEQLVDFMRTEPTALPPTVEHWVRLAPDA
jgi:hypothetical protein